jgi:hypothetical protein
VRSDQFSLCVTFFEALHGIRPFPGENLPALQTSMERGRVAVLDGGRAVPRWLDRVVRRGLAADPEARFRSVGDLVAALERGLARRRRTTMVTVVSGLVGLTAWSWAQSATVEQCTGAQAQLGQVWNDGRREVLHDAMLRTADPRIESVWVLAEVELDRYHGEWIAMYTEACEAVVRGEQPEALRDLKIACLDRAKLDLQAVLNVLSRPETDMLSESCFTFDSRPSASLMSMSRERAPTWGTCSPCKGNSIWPRPNSAKRWPHWSRPSVPTIVS